MITNPCCYWETNVQTAGGKPKGTERNLDLLEMTCGVTSENTQSSPLLPLGHGQ